MGLPLGRWLAGVVALVWASAAQAAAPFEDSMAQRTLACTACHGDQGRAGPDGYYPRLAGKPAGYLYHQLLNFRDGRRHYGPMTRMVDVLSDAYLMDIARHFAALQVPYPPPQPLATPPAPAALEKLRAALADPAHVLLALGSGEALQALLAGLPEALRKPFARIAVVAASARLADAARDAGFRRVAIASDARSASLLRAAVAAFG